MSLTGSLNPADPDKLFKKSFHRRNDSGELDVFEAARYFSGYNESCGATSFNQKITKEQDHHSRGWSSSNSTRGSGGRISLDMPRRNLNLLHHHHDHALHNHHHHHHVVMEKQIKEKKYKQPSSPGGRLASFLNSLFNQSSSKKKIKSKSTTSTSTHSMKDYDQDDQSGGGRRKRRSSISHFGSSSTNTTTDSKASSLYSYNSSSSGFRTPPPYAQLTPTKNFRSFSDNHKQLVSTLSKFNNNNVNKAPQSDHIQEVKDLLSLTSDQKEKKNNTKGSSNALSFDNQKDKINRVENHHHPHHDLKKYHQSSEKKGVFRKFDEEDEGGDSDSSSDLFELQNYDLGCYSSGLPVYETTNMDSIKRGISSAPISNI